MYRSIFILALRCPRANKLTKDTRGSPVRRGGLEPKPRFMHYA